MVLEMQNNTTNFQKKKKNTTKLHYPFSQISQVQMFLRVCLVGGVEK